MEHDFWHLRWTEGKLGFHQQKVNSRLMKLWDTLAPAKGGKVLVPLCGKSLDMLWLARGGYEVVGVEISNIACRAFYVENKLEYAIESGGGADAIESGGGAGAIESGGGAGVIEGGGGAGAIESGGGAGVIEGGGGAGAIEGGGAAFVKYSGGGVEIWCGDFFALKADDLNDIRVVYDRAALIALPDAMRADYAAHLAEILRPGARIFLISMDYDETKMKGPPFSVPENTVRDLFENEFSVEIIAQSSGPDIVGHLADRGLDTLNEKVYLLRRLGGAPRDL